MGKNFTGEESGNFGGDTTPTADAAETLDHTGFVVSEAPIDIVEPEVVTEEVEVVEAVVEAPQSVLDTGTEEGVNFVLKTPHYVVRMGIVPLSKVSKSETNERWYHDYEDGTGYNEEQLKEIERFVDELNGR